ncbi:MAG: hypothetical protein ACREHV_08540 [Rhizomicrobium sp.]
MKEAEAKKRWCPFARVPFHHSTLDYEASLAAESAAGVNRIAGEKGEPVIPAAALCIGSGCAAWLDFGKGDGRCGLTHFGG